jgi:hypothetical protein
MFILYDSPPNGSTAPWGPRPPHFSRLHDHTLFIHTTLGRTPLDEGPGHRRDLYQTTHTTLTRDRHPGPRWDSNPQSHTGSTLLSAITTTDCYHTHTFQNLRYRLLAFFLSYSDFWPVKMGPTCCPEMLVNNYHMTPRNILEERRSHTCKLFCCVELVHQELFV